jgi:hypothetical protein
MDEDGTFIPEDGGADDLIVDAEDAFIQEDEGSDTDDTVDEIITKLSEEHKVVHEQQATITALRSAGIHRPTTPGYKTQYVYYN